MITPGRHTFTIYQAASLRKTLTWLALGEPVNLTGYTARMQLRSAITDATPALTLTTENGGIVLSPLTGQINILATPAETLLLVAPKYLYDIILISASGEATRLMEGTIAISKGITR